MARRGSAPERADALPDDPEVDQEETRPLGARTASSAGSLPARDLVRARIVGQPRETWQLHVLGAAAFRTRRFAWLSLRSIRRSIGPLQRLRPLLSNSSPTWWPSTGHRR